MLQKDDNTYQYNLYQWYFCSVLRDGPQGQQRRSPTTMSAEQSRDDGGIGNDGVGTHTFRNGS